MQAPEVTLRPPGSLDGAPIPITSDLAYLRTAIVTVVYVGAPEATRRVLVDAGLPGTADAIASAAARRHGDRAPASRPARPTGSTERERTRERTRRR